MFNRFVLTVLLCTGCAGPAPAQTFEDFVADVLALPAAEQQASVNVWLSGVASYPHTESDTVAVFLFTGTASSMAVAGDFNGWNPTGGPMTRLGTTSLWYRKAVFETDARLDYKLVRNGNDWILDPRNPHTVAGGFGPNSELAMPAYVQPAEIERRAGQPSGTLVYESFASPSMGDSRTLGIYTPPGYEPQRAEAYPVVLYHDGTDYTSLGSVPTILDNLIADGRIEPLIALFLKPNNRETEYATTRTAASMHMVVSELMPWVAARYAISSDPSRRAVTGASYGGLNATRQCFEHPEAFGLCGAFSPSYWVANGELVQRIAAAAPRAVRWYVDWGTYEGSIARTGPAFVQDLTEKGYLVRWSEWHEGHSWGSWRAHQDNMLEYFFPGTNPTSRSESSLPPAPDLSPVYPNPVTGSARIAFSLHRAQAVRLGVFDAMGRPVATLIDGVAAGGRHEFLLTAHRLAAGAYFVRLATAVGITTQSVVVVR